MKDYKQIHHAKLNGITYLGREALLQLIQGAKDEKGEKYLFMFCGVEKKEKSPHRQSEPQS